MSWLAYGDCLITGSLLEQVDDLKSRARVIGTGITESVFPLLQRPPAIAESVFAGMPAFYAIRSHSTSAVVRDLIAASSWLGRHLSSDDVALFDNATSARNAVICARSGCRRIEVPRRRGAYLDRHECYADLLPGIRPFEPAARPERRASRMLINPCARSLDRQLPLSMVENLVRIASAKDIEIVLLDMNGNFEVLRDRVDIYYREPALHDSAALLKSSDCYVGPDSFFVHLAYYFRVPSLPVFHRSNEYFMPPGIKEAGQYIYFDELQDIGIQTSRIDEFLTG